LPHLTLHYCKKAETFLLNDDVENGSFLN
jgi:hypothetical protein